MNNVATLHIDEKKLDNCYYFQSLLEEAYDKKYFLQSEIYTIQSQLLIVLEQQIELLTEGKSSSISMEKAQILLESICYVISYQLKTMAPEEAIFYLKEYVVKDIFKQGLSLIQLKMNELKQRHQQLVGHLLKSENVFYQSTIVDGIRGFFQLYDPRFEAQEIHITVDYPACLKRPYLSGIEFIDKYLSYIEIENEFCLFFDEKRIHYLLCGLIQDYRHAFLNIYEYVLLSVLGLIIVGKNYYDLNLTKEDVAYLYDLWKKKTKNDIFLQLKRTYLYFHKKMNLSQNTLTYTTLCLLKLSREIEEALKVKTLDKLFLIPFYKEDQSSFSYSYGQKMDDQLYQQLVNDLFLTDDILQRVHLILSSVTSLADFLDLLHDIEFQELELSMILEKLSLIDLVVLMKQFSRIEFLENENEKKLFHVIEKRKQTLSYDEKRKMNVIAQMYEIESEI